MCYYFKIGLSTLHFIDVLLFDGRPLDTALFNVHYLMLHFFMLHGLMLQ